MPRRSIKPKSNGRQEPQTEEQRAALRKRAQDSRQNLTPAEQRLWSKLDGSKLGHKFHCKHLIGYYIADFYCIEAQLVIDINATARQGAGSYDKRRAAYLESRGLRLMRFTNNDIMTGFESVLESISQKLDGE